MGSYSNLRDGFFRSESRSPAQYDEESKPMNRFEALPPPPIMYRSDMTIDDEDAQRLSAMSQFERELELERRMQNHEMLMIQRQVYEKRRLLLSKKERRNNQTMSHEIDSGPVVILNADEIKSEDMDVDSDDDVIVADEVFKDTEEGELSSSSSSECRSRGYRSRSTSCSSSSCHKISTKEQLETCRLRRQDLAELCHAPFFNQYVIGCYVRIHVNKTGHGEGSYRVQEIVGLEDKDDKPYELQNTWTSTYLHLKCGGDEHVYPMSFVSNSPITDDEFSRWMRVATANNDLPLLDDIHQIAAHVQEFRKRKLTDEDISYMLERKERFKFTDDPHGDEKKQIEKRMVEAKKLGQMDVVVKCKAELNAFNAPAKKETKPPVPAAIARHPSDRPSRNKNAAADQSNATDAAGEETKPPVPAAITRHPSDRPSRHTIAKVILEPRRKMNIDDLPFIRKTGFTRLESIQKNPEEPKKAPEEQWFYSPYFKSRKDVEEELERLLIASGYVSEEE
uniref:Plus3 domain-containing protein n=1 Tax=Steinernema glaseri TaxID=37863 RepID=A0A1I7YZP9_9BILA